MYTGPGYLVPTPPLAFTHISLTFRVQACLHLQDSLEWVMFLTLCLIWCCFADTFVWHICNLSGTVASLAPFPTCFKFRACPTEPHWDPPLRAGTVQSDHTCPTEWALGSDVLCEYAQRRHNPLSSICQCHCCKRETDVLHCRFTLDPPVFSLLSLFKQHISQSSILFTLLVAATIPPFLFWLSLPSFHTHTLPNFIYCLSSICSSHIFSPA